MSEPITTSGTVNTGITFAVCGCCNGCNDAPLTRTIVMCATCGGPCSCRGCVAEDDAR